MPEPAILPLRCFNEALVLPISVLIVLEPTQRIWGSTAMVMQGKYLSEFIIGLDGASLSCGN